MAQQQVDKKKHTQSADMMAIDMGKSGRNKANSLFKRKFRNEWLKEHLFLKKKDTKVEILYYT